MLRTRATGTARTWLPRLRGTAAGKPRFTGLDAARGLAVLGMVVAHTAVLGLWDESPTAYLGFVHGRSSILFAMIAGISLALMSGGSRIWRARR